MSFTHEPSPESKYEHERCEDLIDKLQQDLYATRLLSELYKDALTRILDSPYGCAYCDSGKLRNTQKDHDERCGFAQATDLLGE